MMDDKGFLTDETLTAYALGELNAADAEAVERAIDEAALSGDEQPLQAVEAIRAVAEVSREAFARADVGEELNAAQRAAVTAALPKPRSESTRRLRRLAWATAATVLLVVAAAAVLPMLSRAREAASWRTTSRVEPETVEQRRSPFEDLGLGTGTANRDGATSDSATSDDTRGPVRALGYIGQSDNAEEQAQTQEPQSSKRIPPEVMQKAEALVAKKHGISDSEADGRIALLPEASRPDPTPKPQLTSAGEAATQTLALGDTPSINNHFAPGDPNRERLRSLGYLDDADAGVRVVRVPRDPMARVYYRPEPQRPVSRDNESYARFNDNQFVRVSDAPLSTFSIDVDTASYANVRRFLTQGQLPPRDAVRVEELINYFDYDYAEPDGEAPFAAHMEAGACPWAPEHRLVQIGLKGKEVPREERPPANLVFLLDVSGSMADANKLPLVKQGMSMLVRQLDARDRVAIVTYASTTGVALESTSAVRQADILNAIDRLQAGGRTNGSGGIQAAYGIAREHFMAEGVNRVILATDGDFNVGITDNGALETLIQREARGGVYLTVLGFGMGNLKDDRLEMLSNKGNGTYAYVDSLEEAREVFVEDLTGTLVTIAKDVKIQVEFNPARVEAYRLIGYENRALAPEDFNDDRKDAGEIGAGHTVTALYEIVPAGMRVPGPNVDPLRYRTQTPPKEEAEAAVPAGVADEVLLLKVRYKDPEGSESKLLKFPLRTRQGELPETSADFKFASATAAFGGLLRRNPLGPDLSYDGMVLLAQRGLAGSDDPRRAELIHLMLRARPMLEPYAGVPGTNDPRGPR